MTAFGRWIAWSRGSVNRQIFGAAVTVGVVTFFVSCAVILKDLLVAYRFGTSDEMDAFLIAWLIPAFASTVVAEPFTAALIPTYVQIRAARRSDDAAGMFQVVLGRSLLVFIAVTILLAAISPWALAWVGGRFSPQKMALTQTLFLLLLPCLALNGIATIWSAALNAGERFALASLAPIAVPIGAMLGLYLFSERWGMVAVAVGTTVGYLLKCVTLAPAVQQRVGRWRPRWYGYQAELGAVRRQYLITVCGALLMASTLIVDQTMGAQLPAGSVASLTYGMKIVTFLLGLASVALGTAVLPHLSSMVARSDWPAVRRTIGTYTRILLIVGSMAALILFVTSGALVDVIYQRGAFTKADSLAVSRILSMFALQVPFFLVGTLFVRLAFALQRSKVLLWGALISVPLNIVLNWVFMKRFGAAGIALSTSCVYLVSAVFLWFMVVRPLRLVGLETTGLGTSAPSTDRGEGRSSSQRSQP